VSDLPPHRPEDTRREARRFLQLFESSPLPMWVYDLETLAFLEVNDVACAKYGYTRDEFLAMTIRDIRPAEDVGAVEASVREMPTQASHSGIWRHRLKDGRLIFVEITSHEMRYRGRRVRFVCPVDVTQRVQAETALRESEAGLRRLNDELERRVAERTAALAEATAAAQRANDAKSDFLSHVSHELRTPLNAIIGFAQLLALPDVELARDKQVTYARNIQQAGEHLLAVIGELLNFAQIEAGKLQLDMQPVALAPVLAECEQMIRPQAEARQLQLCFAPVDPSLQVHADRTRLKQVLLNLLSNAVKYNRPGGAVELTIDPRAGTVRLAVQDTGPGLSADQQAQLFQPFNRLGRPGEGTGLGLVVTHRLVEAMGGRLGLDSQPGAGSRFWVELGLSPGAPG
jgi:PAS domain S-box-containing protein